jgi:hypothetical protein
MKTITKFLFALLLLLAGASSVQAQRVYAYGLHHAFREDIQMHYFYFSSGGELASGDIIFYDSETNEEIGRRTLTSTELTSNKNNANGSLVDYTVSVKTNELIELTGYTKNIKWGVEIKGNSCVNSQTIEATEALKDLKNYNLSSYETEGGALYQKVREPEVVILDHELRSPRGVVVDNNPQSPGFGRLYVANAPCNDGNISSRAKDPGIVIYPPYRTGTYNSGSNWVYMPTGVEIPQTLDENSRDYMHRIAVHPSTGDVYYCKSTSSEFSAIYKATPVNSAGLTDNGAAINVTRNIIPENNPESSPLHPINSLAFGPDGSLYVMCGAGGDDSTLISGIMTNTRDDDMYYPGNGKIYKLIDNDEDGIYDSYVQHYTPQTETLYDGQSQYGFPYCISPWVHPDNSMAISARGSFWVSQYRPSIYRVEKVEDEIDIDRFRNLDPYSFLAHIAPTDYEYRKQPGTSLADNFQYSMGGGAADTYSGNYITPYWNASQMLAPHQGTRALTEHSIPTGAVAIYEKDGMQGDEAILAVGFSEKVCVFKIFYNEGEKHPDWFGINMDWMFEIPIPGATSIDGLAFDYAGNLYVVSASSHRLYRCAFPDYGAMKDPKATPVQPMTFNEDGSRVETIVNNGQTTDFSNNLDRSKPKDNNVCTTVVADRLLKERPLTCAVEFSPVDGNKWSNENNWNIKRMPTLKDAPVVIKGNVTIDGDQEASGIIVENNSKILITTKGGLTVGEDGFTGVGYRYSVPVIPAPLNYDATITIENTSVVGPDPNEGAGYLRIHPSVTELPSVVVKYNTASKPGSTGASRDKIWQYVGAPGDKTIIYHDYNTWLYKWENETNKWIEQKDGYTNMEPFAGYAITHTNVPSYTLGAKAINEDIEVGFPLYNLSNNIFANSYLAPINVAAFDSTDFGGEVEYTFYLFNSGSWNDWQEAAASNDYNSFESSPGQYTAIPVLGAGNLDSKADPMLIAPMQGVYVVSHPIKVSYQYNSIRLDYEKHVWNPKTGNVAMRAPQKSNLLRRIRIQAFGEKSGSDRMYIIEDKRCTPGYDNGYDAKNMIAAGQVSIYTNEACGTMDVSSTNDMDGMFIGFQASVDTVYTLRFSSLIGENLYIKDLANGNMIELKDDATYTFTAKAHSVNNMRFQVLVDPFMTGEETDGNTTDVDNVQSSNTFWMSDSHICVSTNHANSVATIYNVSGQMIMNVPFNNQIEIPTHNFSTGVYILQIKNERYKFIID